MAPLIALGISLIPSLARLLVGERAGQIAATVTQAVQEITGTDDPEAARGRLEADPAAATQLRLRLAEIALEGERLRAEAEEHERQVALDTLRAGLADLQNARGAMTSLAGIGSMLAWGPAMVSAIVTTGFFGMLGLFLVWTPSAEDQQAYALLNIAVGALVAGFTAVINFRMGSSQSSREKDETVRRLSDAQGDTFGRAQAAMAQTMDQAHAVVADTTERARSAVAETSERAQAGWRRWPGAARWRGRLRLRRLRPARRDGRARRRHAIPPLPADRAGARAASPTMRGFRAARP